MKNFFRLLAGAGLLGIGLLLTHIHRPVTLAHVGATRNKYEVAQHKTVLIVSPEGGQGTGIVVRRHSPSGDRIFVWTAAHVVIGYSKVEVRVVIHNHNHKVGYSSFEGKVLAVDSLVDAALVSIDAPVDYFIPAEFDSPVPPLVGTPVYHVGNFLGADFDNSVSTGVISQIGANPGKGWQWLVTDQTTCDIVPGSSGGPLFNASNDKIVGIVVGRIPGVSMYFYIPVRVFEAWAIQSHLEWAVRGDQSPAVLPAYTPPPPSIPTPLLVPTDPNKKKK